MLDERIMTVPYELLILGAAVESGMFKTLSEKTMTSRELAQELKANDRAVRVIMEALAALGYLKKDGEVYTLSPEARKTLYEPGTLGYIGFVFMHRYKQIRAWLHLPEVISSGKPYPREQSPEHFSYFMSAMQYSVRHSAQAIAEFLLAGTERGVRVLDVGGGPLAHAGAFAGIGAKVTVLDVPEVVNMMKGEAEVAGINMIPGDFNKGLPEGKFELIYLGNICHIYSEKENQKLFERVINRLSPGGRIVIAEFIRNEDSFAAIFAVNMLVNTLGGSTWTMEQYTGWLEAAGFSSVQLSEVCGNQLIVALNE